MATLGTLLKLADSMYPNAVPVEDKVDYMNMALDELSKHFGYIVEDDTVVTVADQDSYDFPTGVSDVSDIISLAVANQATPTDRYDYTQYHIARAEQNPMAYNSFYQIFDSTGAKKFVLYPEPTTDDYEIIIRYRKKLTRLNASDLSVEPEFNERYHNLLPIFCCHMICSIGPSPDAYQADMFMQKYESILDGLWRDMNEQKSAEKRKRKDNPQWHRYGSYGRGD